MNALHYLITIGIVSAFKCEPSYFINGPTFHVTLNNMAKYTVIELYFISSIIQSFRYLKYYIIVVLTTAAVLKYEKLFKHVNVPCEIT